MEPKRTLFLTRLSYLSHILPYFGYLHECAELMTRLSKDTKQVWEDNQKIILEVILVKAKRMDFQIYKPDKFYIYEWLLRGNKFNYYSLILELESRSSFHAFTKFIEEMEKVQVAISEGKNKSFIHIPKIFKKIIIGEVTIPIAMIKFMEAYKKMKFDVTCFTYRNSCKFIRSFWKTKPYQRHYTFPYLDFCDRSHLLRNFDECHKIRGEFNPYNSNLYAKNIKTLSARFYDLYRHLESLRGKQKLNSLEKIAIEGSYKYPNERVGQVNFESLEKLLEYAPNVSTIKIISDDSIYAMMDYFLSSKADEQVQNHLSSDSICQRLERVRKLKCCVNRLFYVKQWKSLEITKRKARLILQRGKARLIEAGRVTIKGEAGSYTYKDSTLRFLVDTTTFKTMIELEDFKIIRDEHPLKNLMQENSSLESILSEGKVEIILLDVNEPIVTSHSPDLTFDIKIPPILTNSDTDPYQDIRPQLTLEMNQFQEDIRGKTRVNFKPAIERLNEIIEKENRKDNPARRSMVKFRFKQLEEENYFSTNIITVTASESTDDCEDLYDTFLKKLSKLNIIDFSNVKDRNFCCLDDSYQMYTDKNFSSLLEFLKASNSLRDIEIWVENETHIKAVLEALKCNYTVRTLAFISCRNLKRRRIYEELEKFKFQRIGLELVVEDTGTTLYPIFQPHLDTFYPDF